MHIYYKTYINVYTEFVFSVLIHISHGTLNDQCSVYSAYRGITKWQNHYCTTTWSHSNRDVSLTYRRMHIVIYINATYVKFMCEEIWRDSMIIFFISSSNDSLILKKIILADLQYC